jgi:hypothetical protein
MIYDPVPRLPDQMTNGVPAANAKAPAVVSYIIRTHEIGQEGQPVDTLYFYIGRDRSIPLRSFTISYRISALPVMIDDPASPYYTYEYTDADIDDHEFLLCSFSLPREMAENFPGCSAYVSEIRTVGSEEPITFKPENFVYSAEDAQKVQTAMKNVYGEETLRIGDAGTESSSAGHAASSYIDDGADEFMDTLEITRLEQENSEKNERHLSGSSDMRCLRRACFR